MKKRLVWIGAVLSLGLFAAATWSVTHPGFAIAELQDYVTRKTGRTLVVNGDARLEFFPRLGVRLDNVFLSNPKAWMAILPMPRMPVYPFSSLTFSAAS